ncbi:hypothetical protein Asp14428_74610 [Actinoplanes sp. NBRC 14428]|nr:hypothetical protein Asp14428_74610 [Actinoplanes sp. NBRC 14428]
MDLRVRLDDVVQEPGRGPSDSHSSRSRRCDSSVSRVIQDSIAGRSSGIASGHRFGPIMHW